MASSAATSTLAEAAIEAVTATAFMRPKDEEDDDDGKDDDVRNTTLRSCANDPDFAIICAFLQKFSQDLGIELPNYKQLQEWLTNTDEVADQLRDLHIKLLRKTRKTVHEKSWESALSKFCFTYAAQDCWEVERFGYKKSSLKVKLRILRELLESQFERNTKFRNKILTLSADSLRAQPIGRDRLGHSYWLTQDGDCNLRVYQEHLDEEIWQVVATNREEFVQLITRLRGNEVVLPSTDIGVIDEDTSSSNSGAAVLSKPPPPEEQDDSQEEDDEPLEELVKQKLEKEEVNEKVPNLRIKLHSNGDANIDVSKGEEELAAEEDAKRQLKQQLKQAATAATNVATNTAAKVSVAQDDEEDVDEEEEDDEEETAEEEEDDDDEDCEEDDVDSDDAVVTTLPPQQLLKPKLTMPDVTKKVKPLLLTPAKLAAVAATPPSNTQPIVSKKRALDELDKSANAAEDNCQLIKKLRPSLLDSKREIKRSRYEKSKSEDDEDEDDDDDVDDGEDDEDEDEEEEGEEQAEDDDNADEDDGDEEGEEEDIDSAAAEEDENEEKDIEEDDDDDDDPIVGDAIEEPTLIVRGEGAGKECDAGNTELLSFLQTQLEEEENPLDAVSAFDDDDIVDEEDQVGEAIEEPVFLVHGEGAGHDCDGANPKEMPQIEQEDFFAFDIYAADDDSDTEPEFSEAIEEETVYISGEGCGAECLVGNPKHNEEEPTSTTSVEPPTTPKRNEPKATFFFGEPGCLKLSPIKSAPGSEMETMAEIETGTNDNCENNAINDKSQNEPKTDAKSIDAEINEATVVEAEINATTKEGKPKEINEEAVKSCDEQDVGQQKLEEEFKEVEMQETNKIIKETENIRGEQKAATNGNRSVDEEQREAAENKDTLKNAAEEAKTNEATADEDVADSVEVTKREDTKQIIAIKLEEKVEVKEELPKIQEQTVEKGIIQGQKCENGKEPTIPKIGNDKETTNNVKAEDKVEGEVVSKVKIVAVAEKYEVNKEKVETKENITKKEHLVAESAENIEAKRYEIKSPKNTNIVNKNDEENKQVVEVKEELESVVVSTDIELTSTVVKVESPSIAVVEIANVVAAKDTQNPPLEPKTSSAIDVEKLSDSEGASKIGVLKAQTTCSTSLANTTKELSAHKTPLNSATPDVPILVSTTATVSMPEEVAIPENVLKQKECFIKPENVLTLEKVSKPENVSISEKLSTAQKVATTEKVSTSENVSKSEKVQSSEKLSTPQTVSTPEKLIIDVQKQDNLPSSSATKRSFPQHFNTSPIATHQPASSTFKSGILTSPLTSSTLKNTSIFPSDVTTSAPKTTFLVTSNIATLSSLPTAASLLTSSAQFVPTASIVSTPSLDPTPPFLSTPPSPIRPSSSTAQFIPTPISFPQSSYFSTPPLSAMPSSITSASSLAPTPTEQTSKTRIETLATPLLHLAPLSFAPTIPVSIAPLNATLPVPTPPPLIPEVPKSSALTSSAFTLPPPTVAIPKQIVPPYTSSRASIAAVHPNRKRRLADFVTAARHSTSESELDLHTTDQQEITVAVALIAENLDEEDTADVGGKRLKMRGKLTNTDIRKKVEAQKIAVEETTSSSGGEEDARRMRKIISPKRQLISAKTTKVLEELTPVTETHEKKEQEPKELEKRALEKKMLEKKELEKKELQRKELDNKELERRALERKELERKEFERKSLERKMLEKKEIQRKEVEIKALEKKEMERKDLEKKELAKKEMAKKELERKEVKKKELEKKELEKKELEKKELPLLTTKINDVKKPHSVGPQVKYKPTLAEIIEKKLKKTPEKPSAASTSNQTSPIDPVVVPIKKAPITKPLKKNLLTQLRQDESDEEHIPRKRTISETVEQTKPADHLLETREKLNEIVRRTSDRRTPDRQRKRRSSEEVSQTDVLNDKLVTECVGEKQKKSETQERGLLQRQEEKKTLSLTKRLESTPEREETPTATTTMSKINEETSIVESSGVMKLLTDSPMEVKPMETSPDKKKLSKQVKALEKLVETTTLQKVKPMETMPEKKIHLIEMKAMETSPVTPKESNENATKAVINEEKIPPAAAGRRSGRRGGAAVVYSELPQPKRTRGAKIIAATLSTPKKELIKVEKMDETPCKSETILEVKNPTLGEKKDTTKKPEKTNEILTENKESTITLERPKEKPKESKAEKPEGEKPAEKLNKPKEAELKINTPKVATPKGRGRGRKKREIDTTTNTEPAESTETPVRQSRRIAQQKIKEEDERRKLEEIALRSMKNELKKKKKAEAEADPTLPELSEHSSYSNEDQDDDDDEASEVETKKLKKKKCPGKDGTWSSGSEEQEEPEEEEEPPHYETDPGSPLFRSDHEFSPESDLEDESQVVPMKRARTARKEDAVAGDSDSEVEESACQKCGKSDHPEWILLCDSCDKGYHCSCLLPVLFYIPEGDWYCPPCQQAQLIAALEQQLQEFDGLVEKKRLDAEEILRQEAEAAAQLAEQTRLDQQKRKKHKKKHDATSDEDGDEEEDKGERNPEKGKSSDEDDEDDGDDTKLNSKKKKSKKNEANEKTKRRRDGGSGNSHRRRRRAATRGARRRRRNASNSGSSEHDSSASSRSGSGSDSGSGSSSSSSATDSDDEPIYKLRKRRQINVSYRLNEYDELINSALKKEMDAAGNLGRGKDITTIIEADKEVHEVQLQPDDDGQQKEELQSETAVVEGEDNKKLVDDTNPTDKKKKKLDDNEEEDSEEEPLKRTSNSKKTLKKKSRKLTTLDISSEEDNASDEDFKTSSFDEEDEDTTVSLTSNSDSSLEIYRRRKKGGSKKKKTRKAARRAARERRKDRKFVVDESDDEEEVKRPIKKKKRKDSDYTESEESGDDLSELSENMDSADLCDDSTSSGNSDGAWRPSKRKKQRKTQTNIARKSPKLKKPQTKKPKRVEYSDDDISEDDEEEEEDDDATGGAGGKGSGKQPRSVPLKSSSSGKGKGKGKGKGGSGASGSGGSGPKNKKKPHNSDEDSCSDSEDSNRGRTRGRRYAYLEDFEDDSSDGGIKPGVQRPDTPPEERAKFIRKQEEIKRMLAEKNAEGAKLAATPRLTPIKGAGEKASTLTRSPAKLGGGSDSLSTVPLSVIRQAKVLDIDYLQRKGECVSDVDNVDDVDSEFDDADLPDDFPEDMDEDAIARMVEEEEEFVAGVATRELPAPDEVLKATTTTSTTALLKTKRDADNKALNNTTPSPLAALTQMPSIGGPSTSASGLQEPQRKRLPMPTMHPPLLRHQYPGAHASHHPGLAHMLHQRHHAAAPPTHLLQHALSAPLGQPMHRNFPQQGLGQHRLPPGVGASGLPPRHTLPPPHLMTAPPQQQQLAASHPMPAANAVENEPKPRGRRKKITPLRDPLQKQQAAAAATAAAAVVQGGASEKIEASSAGTTAANASKAGVIKTTSAANASTTSSSSATLSIAQPPQLYKPPGGAAPPGQLQPSVITRMPHLPPHAVPPPGRGMPLGPRGMYPGLDVPPRFYGLPPGQQPPPSSAPGARQPHTAASSQRGHRGAPQGLPPGMSAAHQGMRPSYGPPPPLRGASAQQPQPPPGSRSSYPTPTHAGGPGDHHASPGGPYRPPPPARHAAPHMNPYRPSIFGNPNYSPRAAPPGANLRTAGVPPGAEYPAGPRSYAPYGYYPPPPPLTAALQQQQQQQQQQPQSSAHPPRSPHAPPTHVGGVTTNQQQQQQQPPPQTGTTTITKPSAPSVHTASAPPPPAVPSSVIVAAPPANLSMPPNHAAAAARGTSTKSQPPQSPPPTAIAATIASDKAAEAAAATVANVKPIASEPRKKLIMLETYATASNKSPLALGGESSGSRSSPNVQPDGADDSSSTPAAASAASGVGQEGGASEFSGLVSYFSSQHDDYNT